MNKLMEYWSGFMFERIRIEIKDGEYIKVLKICWRKD